MIRSLTTAVSGLRNHQLKMDVIGNNIANVNTVAFKSGQVRFEDLLSQMIQGGTAPYLRGGINPMQVGLGMRTSSIANNFTQGAFQGTSRETDLAIEGEGFFVVTDGRGLFYTRDGNFTRDTNGELVNANGLKLLGWAGEEINQATLAPIHIPLGESMVARATGNLYFAGNLDARMEAGEEYAYETYVYDSLGRRHDVLVTITRDSVVDNRWTYELEDLESGATATGTLIFDSNGVFDEAASTLNPLTFTPAGADPLSVEMHFSGTTQLAGPSNLLVRSQDGFATGELITFSIGRTGVITGTYSNGMTKELGQIALAYFVNPGGLEKVGGNLFQVSPNSGDARIGLPGVDGRGMINASTLEMSNTDLSYEFTEMITTSRAFQANIRVITTSDEILMEVINLKR